MCNQQLLNMLVHILVPTYVNRIVKSCGEVNERLASGFGSRLD